MTTVTERPSGVGDTDADPGAPGPKHLSSWRQRLTAAYDRILAFIVGTPWSSRGVCVLRVGYGIVGVLFYLTNFSDRYLLWGPDAAFRFESFSSMQRLPLPSIYLVATNATIFDAFFFCGLLVALAFALGFGGRLTNLAHYVFMFSLFQRNPLLLDGGDNLTYLVLFYLLACRSTAHYSIDAIIRRRRTGRFIPMSWSTPPAFGNLVHNAGAIAIAVQVCLMYWTSAMFKVQGKMWQDGTALYYIMRVPEFSRPGLSELVYTNGPLVFVLTYFTVFSQLAFPPLMLHSRLRGPVVAVMALFHIGIALFMNLWTFSIIMIATEMIFVSDSHFDRWAARLRARIIPRQAERYESL